MITIFVLLGLAFLGGGAAAIVDGWPYLVLERGFTEVIIGAIAATTGFLMLALSYVLIEIRRVRTSLSNAVLAASLASMVGEPAPAQGAAHSGLGAAGAATGLGLATGAAVIAGRAAHAAQPDVPPDAEPAAEHEADLFGELLARTETPSPAAEEADAPAPFGEPKPAIPLEAEPAIAEHEAKEHAPEEAKADKAEPTDEAAAEPLQTMSTEAEPEGAAQTDIESSFEELLHWPEAEPRSSELAAAGATGFDDEFGALRDSLSRRLQLGEPEAAPASAETETPLSASRDPEAIESAAAWMESPSRKHDSWFPDDGDAHDSTPAETPQAEADLPPWPPVTHDVEALELEHEAEPVAAPAGEDTEGKAGEDAVAPGKPGAEAPDDEAAAAAPPAASEEGIVGAYQVGDAHFTIFADGSIKARTPDGDYNFTSMDELKIYLASEKSRLGV